MFSNQPLVPKNSDGVLRIISIGRLSQPKETEAATQQSLDAIRRENERLLKSIYSGATIVKYLAEQVSGMLAERATITELWELVASGEWDLIIAEDLSRIFRNPAFQLLFLQQCADAGIRVICFADHLDTADESWESAALLAATRHGLMIPDTRRRIKRTATESFKRGGMVLKVKFAYVKVSREDAAAGKYGPKGLRIRRLEEYQWVVDEICRRLHAGESPRYIVTWLNSQRIPCGQYVKSGRWTLRVFRDLLQDPILHGTRSFRDVLHKLIFNPGGYKREKNASPELEYVAELAFMTREQQEVVLDTVGWAIDWGGNRPPKRPHVRKGVSRYESFWPGQSCTCSICGEVVFVCGEHVRCGHSFPHLDGACWNHVQAPITPFRAALVEWLVARCNESLEFRNVLVDAATHQLLQLQDRSHTERDVLAAKVKELEGQERNLRRSIGIAAKISEEGLTALVEDHAAVTKQLRSAESQLKAAHDSTDPVGLLTGDEIVAHLPAALKYLLETSFEMAEVVRGLVPRCVIVPVQSYDTGQVYARVKLWLRGNMQNGDDLTELVVDLFEPPLHIRHMAEAVKLRSQTPQPTLKQIGAQLGVSHMTVKRALRYARLMQQLGVTEPFRELEAKPANAPRWRDAS